MAKKKQNFNDSNYEYNYFSMNELDHYRFFGWEKAPDAPTSVRGKGKKKETVYLSRRRSFVAADPSVSRFEKRYNVLAKKNIKPRPLWGIITFLFMLIFLVLTVAELWIGVGDLVGKARNNRVLGIYNFVAAEQNDKAEDDSQLWELIQSETDESGADVLVIPSQYYAFKKENPTVDTFAEAVQYLMAKFEPEAEVTADCYETRAAAYANALVALKLVEDQEGAGKLDVTLKPNEEGEYVFENDVITTILDYPRQYINGTVDLDETLSGLGISFLTTPVAIGVVGLILYIVFTAIFFRIVSGKRRKAEKEEEMKTCLVRGEYAYRELKQNNPSLMTASERKIYDMQSMITEAIRRANNY